MSGYIFKKWKEGKSQDFPMEFKLKKNQCSNSKDIWIQWKKI